MVHGREVCSSRGSAVTPGGAARRLLARRLLCEPGGDRDDCDARDGDREEREGGASSERSDWSPAIASKSAPPCPWLERAGSRPWRESGALITAPESSVRPVSDVTGRGSSPDTLSPPDSGPECSVSPRLSGRPASVPTAHPRPREDGERNTPLGCRRGLSAPLSAGPAAEPVGAGSRGHSDAVPGTPAPLWALAVEAALCALLAGRWPRYSN